MEISFQSATVDDAPSLAEMNLQLIRDEGHRNPMSLMELTQRMTGWLEGEYEAVLFQQATRNVGYALYRREPEHIYLRQFFVEQASRRSGIGRAAISWMWAHVWTEADRIRLDVLVGNTSAHLFWLAAGFTDYCITMEATRQQH